MAWQPTIVDERWDVPEGVEVETKIDDEHGERNLAKLIRRGNLWFTGGVKDGMYVYYTPTHYRPS